MSVSTKTRFDARLPLIALLAGQLISWTGNRVNQVALPLLLIERYGVGPELGLLAFAGLLPRLLLGPWAGGLADRLPLRGVIATANLATAALVLLIPRTSTPGQLYLLGALMGAIGAVSVPANYALLPRVFPEGQLLRVNTAQEALDAASNLLGPGIAVALVGTFGIAGAFAADAASFVVAAATLLLLRPRPQTQPRTPMRAEAEARHRGLSLGGVLGVLRGDRTLALLLLVNAAYSVGVGVLLVLYAPLALFDLRAGEAGYGVLVTATGVGALLGVALTPRLAPRLSPRTILGLLGASGVALASVSLAPDIRLAAALLGLALLPESFSYLVFSTESQRRVSAGMAGRYFGVVLTMLAVCVPTGKLVGGWLGAGLGPRTGVAVVGLGWAATALLGWLWTVHLDRRPPP